MTLQSNKLSKARQLGVHRLVTRDVRHVAAVRLAGGRGFELVVHPTISRFRTLARAQVVIETWLLFNRVRSS